MTAAMFPPARIVDALTGKRAPDVFFKANSEADSFCREVTEAANIRAERDELLTRVDELTEELDDVRRLHRLKVDACATLARKLELMTADRDNWRAAAQCVRNA